MLVCGAVLLLRDGGVSLLSHTSAYDAHRGMRSAVSGVMLGPGAVVLLKCVALVWRAFVRDEDLVMG